MLQSYIDTAREISRVLTNGGTLSIPFGSSTLSIPVFYARKSADDLTEQQREAYPQASLLDYMPKPNFQEWNTNYSNRIDEFSDIDPVTKLPTKAVVFKELTQLELDYDLGFYVKNPMQRYAIIEYMLKTYADIGSIVLNPTVLDEGVVGNFVRYSLTYSEVPRSDKVFELNFQFSFKPFVYLSSKEEVDLIESFNLIYNQQ